MRKQSATLSLADLIPTWSLIMQASFYAAPARRLCRAIAGAALFSALAACGYKGPLYMPPPPPPPDAKLTAPPTPAALPADNSTSQPAISGDTAAPAAVQ
jgi:predicted small lipoprotein YifL